MGDGLKAGYVRTLIEYKDELYAGGSFNESGTEIVNYIAKWYGPPTVTEISGCTYPGSSNYDSTATVDDGSCLLQGCTDPAFDNYNPLANFDNGSCENNCIGDLNNDAIVNTVDLLIFLGAFGNFCP
jgi:hypothetical protein